MQVRTASSHPVSNISNDLSKRSSQESLQDTIQPVRNDTQTEEKAVGVNHLQMSSGKPTGERSHDDTPSSAKLQKAVKMLNWFIKDQWFLIAMGLLILISSRVQVPIAQQRVKRTVITYLSVSVIFFVNGCTLSTRLLIENYMRWKLHAFVQLQCYLVTSAATFAIVSLCATNRDFSTESFVINICTTRTNTIQWTHGFSLDFCLSELLRLPCRLMWL
jgi:sodium/bile acid cotransporter 7